MTKENLLLYLAEKKFHNFLQEFRFQVETYLKNKQNENIKSIMVEISTLISTEGSMAEDVDYRKMSYDSYLIKVEELKLKAKKLVEMLPDDFSEITNLKKENIAPEVKPNQQITNIEFSEFEAEMTNDELKQVRSKFISTSSIWGLLSLVSFSLILLLPKYLKDLAQLAIIVFIISLPVFLIYFSMNFKLLKANKKTVLKGTLRKYSRLSKTKKNRHLKYFFSLDKYEYMVTIFEYNKFEDYDYVEMHICKSNNKILAMKKVVF